MLADMTAMFNILYNVAKIVYTRKNLLTMATGAEFCILWFLESLTEVFLSVAQVLDNFGHLSLLHSKVP